MVEELKEIIGDKKEKSQTVLSYVLIAALAVGATWMAASTSVKQSMGLLHQKQLEDIREAHRVEVDAIKEVHRKEQELFLLGETDGHRKDEDRREAARQREVELKDQILNLKIEIVELKSR